MPDEHTTTAPDPPASGPTPPPGGISRSRQDRMIAGVAGGIAQRLDVDPFIVRAAFVILAVAGGGGVLIYALGWLLLPEEGERGSIAAQALGGGPRNWPRSRPAVFAFLIVVALWSLIRPSHWWFGRPFVAVIVLVGVVLVARRSWGPGSPPPAPVPKGEGFGADPTIADWAARDAEGHDQPAPDPTVPSWSPSSASPHQTAWWAPSAPRQPSLVLPLLAGLAVLVALSGGIAATGWVSFPLAAVLTVGLLMSLAALIAGAQRGRFVGATVISLVFAVALAFSAAVPHPLAGGIGQRTWHPASASELKSSYRLGTGQATLDLSDVILTSGARTVRAEVGTGDLTVTVPANTVVQIRERATIGATAVLGDRQGGVSVDRTSIEPGGGTPMLLLDLQVGIGEIEVNRAAG